MEAVEMMIASSISVDKAETLTKLADDLSKFVWRSVAAGSSLDDVERGAFKRLLAVGHAAVEMFLEAQVRRS
jgi:hypothetical protein